MSKNYFRCLEEDLMRDLYSVDPIAHEIMNFSFQEYKAKLTQTPFKSMDVLIARHKLINDFLPFLKNNGWTEFKLEQAVDYNLLHDFFVR